MNDSKIKITLKRQQAHQIQQAIVVAIANLGALPDNQQLYIDSQDESPHQLKKLFIQIQNALTSNKDTIPA